MSKDVYNYFFIHNVLANFYKSFLDYIADDVYSRFETKVVSTYDKAVEYIDKKSVHSGREHNKPNLPALILNPTGEINTADANAGGKQFFRFPNIAPGLNKGLYDPLYKDNQVVITPSYARLKGEIELIMLLNSFYEYCDIRLLFLQTFNGLDRTINLNSFTTFIILPEEVYSFNYNNPETGQTYTLNWDEYGVSERLIKTINKDKMIYPCNIKPQAKLTGMSDGSTRYGGTDRLADWRLTASLEYEIDVPWYMILQTDYVAENIHWEFQFGSFYSTYGSFEPPVNREILVSHWDTTATSTTTILSDAEIVKKESAYLNTRYSYEVTAADVADATADIIITIPETVTDIDLLYLNSKHGKMSYGDHYVLEDGDTIIIDKTYVTLNEGDFVELYIYKYL